MVALVNWDVAEAVAEAAVREPPISRSYHFDTCAEDLTRATDRAQALVQADTGLVTEGPTDVAVLTRSEWAVAALRSCRRMLSPLEAEAARRGALGRARVLAAPAAGVQVGLLVAWLATRVLGQYDPFGVTPTSSLSARPPSSPEAPREGDRTTSSDGPGGRPVAPRTVYYVGANLLGLERDLGLPPAAFRQWIALHEVTHRVQFGGVPWLLPYVEGLLAEVVTVSALDPARVAELWRSRGHLEADGAEVPAVGLLSAFATPAQRQAISRLQGLMSVLEGHANLTMDRAGSALVPEADDFQRLLGARRRAGRLSAVLARLLGLDAKFRQYEAGSRFLQALEATAGRPAVARLWSDPIWMPDWGEVLDPTRWLGRSELGPEAPGSAAPPP